MLSLIETKGIQMRISPNVIEQDKKINYVLTLKDSTNIQSIELFSKNDYFHKDTVEYKIENNYIYFTYTMLYVGEFVVNVNFTYKESKSLNLYCLDKNMIKLKPLKGDLHMHTIYSDGKRTPLAMCLNSLELGMDFMSITDHDYYEGSLKAIKKVEEANIDILVLPGEEVSVGKGDLSKPKGNGHMLSINANKSIEDQRKDTAVYEKELEEIAENIKKDLVGKNIDPLHYARNIWAIDKIKEADGISILCHPNWIYHDLKYHLHQPLYKEMLENSHLDGIEVIVDINKKEEVNNLASLTYLEIKNKHKYLAPMGNTDAHDIDHDALERFTIVFAKEKTNNSIVDAIRNGLTCAVVKRGENNHQFMGNSDLAHYAYFLIQEYFPKHQELRNKLAKLYVDELINNEHFQTKIENTKRRLEEHYNNFFKN